MTTTTLDGAPPVSGGTPLTIRARPAGFLHDVTSIAGRALRGVPRDIATVIPPIFIALFFFVVNIATLKKLGGAQCRGSTTTPSRWRRPSCSV